MENFVVTVQKQEYVKVNKSHFSVVGDKLVLFKNLKLLQ